MYKRNTLKQGLLGCLALATFGATAAESDYYRIVTYPMPEELKLEVSGLALMPDGRMAAAIRKGEIWMIENAYGDPSKVTYSQWATGLHEPLGLAWHDGALYTTQRTEITRLRDTDNDGRADEYLTFAKGWGVSGSYHEYAYGPVFDQNGNALMTLNISIGKGPVPDDDAWRGWSLKVAPDGTWKPWSGGFRSPSGIGMNRAGDFFATDQQGNWYPTCPLLHLKEGAFHGHADVYPDCSRPEATFDLPKPMPRDLTVVEAEKAIPAYTLPAVWFPYRTMGMSSTDILCDTTEGKFGPFADQLFVGEFTMSFITRVFLEKVDGHYQGAVFRFREGFDCAVLRMAWGKDGSMFVGESNRGWNSLGTRSYGLQRLVWTGKIPFDVKEMHALPNGFKLTFTQPVDPKLGSDVASYAMRSYTYPYHKSYGGDEIDEKKPTITSAKVADGGLTVMLEVEGLRAGYVHELTSKLKSATGLPLEHDLACYTLNRIPK